MNAATNSFEESCELDRDSDCDDGETVIYVCAKYTLLPDYINSKHLRKHFQEFNEHIVHVLIIRDQVTKKTKGYGFITFTSQAAATAAIQKFNGSKLLGKYELLVKFKRSKQSLSGSSFALAADTCTTSERMPSSSASTASATFLPKGPCSDSVQSESDTDSVDEECVIYVRPKYKVFPNYISNKHLYDHFQEFRKYILHARIVRDQATKKSKGFGFITFTSHSAAQTAIERFSGSKLDGKFELFVAEGRKRGQKSGNQRSHSSPKRSSLTSTFSVSSTYPDYASSESDSEPDSKECVLYIRPKYKALPDYVSSQHLTEHFKEFKEHIINTRIIRDRATKKSKGFGFITFSSKGSAQGAIYKLNGSKLLGKFELLVEYEQGKREELRPGKRRLPTPASTSLASPDSAEHGSNHSVLYVRAKYTVLPNYINRQHLQEHFQEFKEHIVNARMIRDHITKKSRGYGFIAFTSVQAAEEAIQKLNDSKLHGKFDLLVQFDRGRSDVTSPSAAIVNSRKKPSSLDKTATMKTSPLKCSPEQMDYLNLVLFKEDSVGQEPKLLLTSLQALPVGVTCQQGQILLSGTQVLTEKAQTIILGSSLLRGLLCHTYPFTCHSKFLKQIEVYVLEPMPREKGLDVLYYCQEYKNEVQDHHHTFAVSIFSKKPAHFIEASKLMQLLDPQSKHFNVEANTKQLMLKLTELGKKNHRCCIQFTDSPIPAVKINGLCSNDIESCWKEIKNYIELNQTIVRRIAVDGLQLKYLQRKHSKLIEKVNRMCTLIIPESATGELLSITLYGRRMLVREYAQRMEEVVKNCTKEEFQILCSTADVTVWNKKWEEFIQEQQENYDILVEYQYSHSAIKQLEGSCSTLVTILIYGSDKSGIRTVKQQILRKSEKKVQLSQVELEVLLRGLKDKKIDLESKYSVMINVNMVSKEVTLSTPPLIKGDLSSAEEDVLRFIGVHTSTTCKEVEFEDPVIGLLLTTTFLPNIMKSGRMNEVFVCPLEKPCSGIQLKGNQAAVENVERIILLTVSKLSQSITTDQYTVSYSYLPVFSTPEFTRFDADLQKELGVICSYPAVGEKSSCKVLRQVCLQNPSGNSILLQICEGCLVQQTVDAIMNEANEDLLLTDGIAKMILEAGGPLVQAECTTYVESKGKVRPGTAVCLGSGHLPCKKVIHFVHSKNDESKQYPLSMAIFSSLRCAGKNGVGSIAFPVIGSQKFPHRVSHLATRELQAVNTHCTGLSPHSSIHTVRIVLSNSQTCEFLKAFDSHPDFSGLAKVRKQVNSSVTLQSSFISPAKLYQWSWENDTKSFSPYSLHISDALTVEYTKNPIGYFSCKIDGKSYKIDFQKMKQINLSTGFTRNIKREQIEGRSTQRNISTFQWYYKDDTGHFVAYSQADSCKIEEMYNQGNPACFILSILGRIYTVDFQNMFQINFQTKHKRSIKREPAIEEEDIYEEEQPPRPRHIVINIRGLQKYLREAKTRIQSKLESLMNKTDIPLPPVMPRTLEKQLIAVAEKHNVTCRIEKQQQPQAVASPHTPKRVLRIEGLEPFLQKAVTEIQTEIIQFQSLSSTTGKVSVPPEWQDQTETVEVFKLQCSSQEWTMVSNKFSVTMPQAIITQILRIQNQWLWEKYVQEKNRIHQKNAGTVNEMELFHGTRTNSPEKIYNSEEGFDMRYSSTGMWGMANYFAMNASYSDAYAYTSPARPSLFGGSSHDQKEIFLAKVLTGDSYKCLPDKTLRMPPLKHVRSTSSEVQLKQVHYDSVNGTTRGSQVYMTYSNNRAYPAYLISYRIY